MTETNNQLDSLFNAYYNEGLKLSPAMATFYGDNRYNDLLPAEFTDSYREKYKDYYTRYLTALSNFKRESLSENDRLSYDIFQWQLKMNLEALTQKDNRMPFNQYNAVPLSVAQFGSGKFIQPFKTVKDYNDWIKRATAFSVWADSAIFYFRKGMAEGVVLPKALVVKIIPQMNSFVNTDATKSVFYGPVTNMPDNFSDSEKVQLTNAYVKLINEQLVPTYQKLRDFLLTEYLPKARTSSGLSAVPGGAAMYDYDVRLITTTHITPDELYNTGLEEVKRIRGEMEKVKEAVGFKGDLNAFLEYLRTDQKFFPYKTPEEVLTAYRAIQQKIEPELPALFLHTPKTPFEIRQTESFRAASASAQYYPGLPDGSRPGIFYVPIVDATKTKIAEESTFAHEAIPGHHYQAMLQFENDSLPQFRRHGHFIAFIEGWGLYSESLGKELGLYTDPYQKMANLSWEIHRAIRLVVDPGLHTKGWTRERAIKYMMDNEPITEQAATAEIERYMAVPGQAVAYKVGGMKLQALRKKYEKELGSAFDIAAFHDEILKDGAMPLDILEEKMDAWASTQKK
ncbi:DUF885 domain-containing protein [Pontibacter chitinilyticus]|uniref:DUF885 domain-containing protein n=1 Tax=Pontibacter chitinilyticus TaxID=2674989 RepID=UPI003219B678